MKKSLILVFVFLLCCTAKLVWAQHIDLSQAQLLISPGIHSPVKETAAKVLQEEVFKRTAIPLPITALAKNQPLIILANIHDREVAGIPVPAGDDQISEAMKPEGFRISFDQSDGKTRVWLIGADDRAIIFAIGQFLRSATLEKKKILLPFTAAITSAPVYKLRGHQLGYRHAANSYDAWSIKQYEQYIRELALFGTNAIENIPHQGGDPGPHMKVSKEEMNLAISKICQQYDLDFWVWTPADVDLSDSVKFNAELKAYIALYQQCPRLDGVFFPGGDPGENHPHDVLPFLEAAAKELKKYHPEAGMWISLQGFSDEQIEFFFDYLDKKKPDWLRGVVSGPGSPDLSTTRFRLPTQYQHRAYPDITHTVRCQYPTLNWDQAFALTEGREVSNPQPFYYAKIHNTYAPFTDGFISYSDGAHDDVNKIIWSQMAWNPSQPVTQILREYSRFYFGETVAKKAADGILGLEKNWDGPLEENGGVEATFSFWQTLEKENPQLKDNWRWQLLLMRAYYDTYTRRRKFYEQALERSANLALADASKIGSDKAMEKALALVNQADREPVSSELKQKILAYCAALFKSVGLQTSVEKYQASGGERGAILDYIDYPLNNRWWLADEFDKVKKMPSEKDKLQRLNRISTWSNPPTGSYYDNVSDVSAQLHVISRSDDATDIAWWDGGFSRKRLSTQLFQNFPKLEYRDLDPNGHYTIRISGYGEALLRVDGERIDPIIYQKELEGFKEFLIAGKYVRDGKLIVSFDQPEESHLNWRQHSKVCDIWLIKE